MRPARYEPPSKIIISHVALVTIAVVLHFPSPSRTPPLPSSTYRPPSHRHDTYSDSHKPSPAKVTSRGAPSSVLPAVLPLSKSSIFHRQLRRRRIQHSCVSAYSSQQAITPITRTSGSWSADSQGIATPHLSTKQRSKSKRTERATFDAFSHHLITHIIGQSDNPLRLILPLVWGPQKGIDKEHRLGTGCNWFLSSSARSISAVITNRLFS